MFLKIEKTCLKNYFLVFCNSIGLRVSWPILVIGEPLSANLCRICSATHPSAYFLNIRLHNILTSLELNQQNVNHTRPSERELNRQNWKQDRQNGNSRQGFVWQGPTKGPRQQQKHIWSTKTGPTSNHKKIMKFGEIHQNFPNLIG